METPSNAPAQQVEIVVVEDKDEDMNSTVSILEEYVPPSRISAFSDVETAEDFIEALHSEADAPRAVAIRLVILDLHVGDRVSLSLVDQLRQHAATRFVPVVLFSDTEDDDSIADALKSGANAFVTKPVDFEAFGKAMRTIAEFWLDTNHGLGGDHQPRRCN